jgi:Tol biopolymer transport system component
MLAGGTRLGPYEVVAPLGAGGMGEVYRARDARLGREVAIKLLPAAFSADPDRLRRFEQEARSAGLLNHPNVLAIYDVGVHEGAPYLVSELLEGETLRERMGGWPLPPRKAIDLAAQVARGLAAAHDKGIVHRDLKPENLFVTTDGRLKILDFGLAKLSRLEGAAEGVTGAPTVVPGTDPGLVLGTVGYMSPEQVRGRATDHRSDIFALGVILYEMLSGRQAFRAESAVETMSAVLKDDPPDLSTANPAVPAVADRIVRHCLEKSPDERFQSARDLAFDLEAAAGTSETGRLPAVSAPRRIAAGSAARFAVVLVLGLLAGAGLGRWLARPSAAEPAKLRVLTFAGRDTEPAASPDGRTIAFTSSRDGRSRIWLKQMPGGAEVALTSGPDARPRFSPDGAAILFTRDEGGGRTSLYRVPVVGGEPRKLLEDALEGDVSPDGRRIAFTRVRIQGATTQAVLGVADASGGGARELLSRENRMLQWPRWSPDGTTIGVTELGTQNTAGSIVVVGAGGEGERAVLRPEPPGTVSSVAWSGAGRVLLYGKTDALAPSALTGQSGRLVLHDLAAGAARTLLWVPWAAMELDILGDGLVVLGALATQQNLREVPIQAGGSGRAERWLTRGTSTDRQPVYSPDGRWVLFSSNRSGNLDLWEVSTETGAARPLTEDAANDWDPAFTADGGSILWSSDRTGHFEIWMADADGSDARQVTDDGVDAENPTATADGRWIVYASANPEKAGVWKVHPDGTGATRIVEGTVLIPEVSPDGRYALYGTNVTPTQGSIRVVRIEDGADADVEILARGTATLVPARGRWMPDGRAIAFIGLDERGAGGVFVQDFVPGRDTSATLRPLAGFDPEAPTESFDLSPDGARLVLAQLDPQFNLMVAEGVAGVAPPGGRR